MKYQRKHETFYSHSEHIAEYFNTLSNLPFIILGLSRLLFTDVEDPYLWYFLISFGVCSGIHHMYMFKGSLIVDYLPIVLCNLYIFFFYLDCIDINDLIRMSIPFFILITDHIYTFVKVPWGHVMWHITASITICNLFDKFEYMC